MRRRYEINECAFPFESTWADFSQHRFQRGGLTVTVGRRRAEPDDGFGGQLEALLGDAPKRLARYELLFRRETTRPVQQTLHLGHAFEDATGPRVELHAFFALGGSHFVVQCAGPRAELEDCEEVMTHFVETFRVQEEDE